MAEASAIRVLLVEDNRFVGDQLFRLLKGYPNIDLVGQASDGEEAVAIVATLQPTVVVMDINLPKLDGIAATRQIKTRYPHILVIGITVVAEEYAVYAMVKAGAYEVVTKERAATDLYSTLQKAVASMHPILIEEGAELPPKTASASEESSTVQKTDVLPAGRDKPAVDQGPDS